MAYTLVFWKDSLDVDVIKTSSIIADVHRGLCARWEGSVYPIKILKQHDNATWLHNHVVNTNGVIVSEPPAPRNLAGQQKPDPRAIRRQVDGPVVYQSSIFDKNEEEEEDDSSKSQLSDTDFEDYTEKVPFTHHRESSKSSGGKVNDKEETNGDNNHTPDNDHFGDDGEFAMFENAASRSEPCGKCGDFPTIPEEAMNCLENIFEYVKERYMSQGTTSRQPIFVDKTRLHKSEVLKGSGIWMGSVFLEITASRYKKNPKEMTRQLLKRMYNPEELPNLAVDDLPGRNKIPDNVYETIEGFVFQNTLERYRLGAAAFKHCVTTTVCTARANERKKDGTARDKTSKEPTKPSGERKSAGSVEGRGKFGPSTKKKGLKTVPATEEESVEISANEKAPITAPTKPTTRSTGKRLPRNLESVEKESKHEDSSPKKSRTQQKTKNNIDDDKNQGKKFKNTFPRKPAIIDVSENVCVTKNREGNFIHRENITQDRSDNDRGVKTASVGSRSDVRIEHESDHIPWGGSSQPCSSERKHQTFKKNKRNTADSFINSSDGEGIQEDRKYTEPSKTAKLSARDIGQETKIHQKEGKRNKRSLFSESDSEEENNLKKSKSNTYGKDLLFSDDRRENPRPRRDKYSQKERSRSPSLDLLAEWEDFKKMQRERKK